MPYESLESAMQSIKIGDDVRIYNKRHNREVCGKVTRFVLPNIVYIKTMVRGKMKEVQEYVSYKQTIEKVEQASA